MPVRSIPKAKAKAKAKARALDAQLGPKFDRKLAAELHPGLANYLEKLEAAYQQNRTPVNEDKQHLALIIEGLNKADPGLRLVHDEVMRDETSNWIQEYQLTQRLQNGLGKGDAWRMVIDDGDRDHRYALSVQCSASSHDASLILVDSMDAASEASKLVDAWQNILGGIGEVLREHMPEEQVRLHLAVACSTTQRTDNGCVVMALSAARKMAAEPQIAQLHGAALGNMNGGAGENVVALSAAALPPSFFKHSTSGNDLINNLFLRDEAGRDPVVNREGQTLLERWTSHMTARRDPQNNKQRLYSNSYEAKRIDLIRTALAALVPQPTR
ncbi:hypothetical protein J2W49_001929 [Hydrogenophaga palleronii]|uniref:Uncharacterized protein n=2 Tax=Hydrogenophaga palleronii TaxID=65655 RepID=A0ABU1WL15_9BURK|nr:hypothetical protein [Hydrogenophaga palleronii]